MRRRVDPMTEASLKRDDDVTVKFDTINYWSEIKHDIIKRYAEKYAAVIHSYREIGLKFSYIDAFSGSGMAISASSGELVNGSPLHALSIVPRFHHHYFIDLDGEKVETLRNHVKGRKDVSVYKGDCNSVLLDKVFPKCQWNDYQRALCVLDPYGLHLSWEVINAAGKAKSVEIFLNFPVMDMNRNALWRDPTGVNEGSVMRMNRFWGNDSWRSFAYTTQFNLFGMSEESKAKSNQEIVNEFCDRLREVAGFAHVLSPLPMYNSIGGIVYYLIFAAHKPAAESIVTHIFDKYRRIST